MAEFKSGTTTGGINVLDQDWNSVGITIHNQEYLGSTSVMTILPQSGGDMPASTGDYDISGGYCVVLAPAGDDRYARVFQVPSNYLFRDIDADPDGTTGAYFTDIKMCGDMLIARVYVATKSMPGIRIYRMSLAEGGTHFSNMLWMSFDRDAFWLDIQNTGGAEIYDIAINEDFFAFSTDTYNYGTAGPRVFVGKTHGSRYDLYNDDPLQNAQFRSNLTAISCPTAGDTRFGYDIELVGSRLTVSAPYLGSYTDYPGRVYTYELADAFASNASPTPVLLHTIQPPEIQDRDFSFGEYVATNGYYTAVAASAEYAADGSYGGGKIYVFRSDTGTYLYTIETPEDEEAFTYAGFGSYIHMDNNYLIVPTSSKVSKDRLYRGEIYVYRISDGELVQRIYNPDYYTDTRDLPPINTEDFFGRGARISGNHIIAGAYAEDSDGVDGSNKGIIYVYTIRSLNEYIGDQHQGLAQLLHREYHNG